MSKCNAPLVELLIVELFCACRKLVISPNGKNAKEYLSVYLAMVETPSLRPGWEVVATFTLFLLDQNRDNYLTVGGNLCYMTNFCWNINLELPTVFTFIEVNLGHDRLRVICIHTWVLIRPLDQILQGRGDVFTEWS